MMTSAVYQRVSLGLYRRHISQIGHFITQGYHQKRPHSALGYLTPIEFQRQTLS